MAEVIRTGTHVRVFENGAFIGCGFYAGMRLVHVDIQKFSPTTDR